MNERARKLAAGRQRRKRARDASPASRRSAVVAGGRAPSVRELAKDLREEVASKLAGGVDVSELPSLALTLQRADKSGKGDEARRVRAAREREELMLARELGTVVERALVRRRMLEMYAVAKVEAVRAIAAVRRLPSVEAIADDGTRTAVLQEVEDLVTGTWDRIARQLRRGGV